MAHRSDSTDWAALFVPASSTDSFLSSACNHKHCSELGLAPGPGRGVSPQLRERLDHRHTENKLSKHVNLGPASMKGGGGGGGGGHTPPPPPPQKTNFAATSVPCCHQGRVKSVAAAYSWQEDGGGK